MQDYRDLQIQGEDGLKRLIAIALVFMLFGCASQPALKERGLAPGQTSDGLVYHLVDNDFMYPSQHYYSLTPDGSIYLNSEFVGKDPLLWLEISTIAKLYSGVDSQRLRVGCGDHSLEHQLLVKVGDIKVEDRELYTNCDAVSDRAGREIRRLFSDRLTAFSNKLRRIRRAAAK